MAELIISISGVRGRVDDELTPHVAMRYANVLAGTLHTGLIVNEPEGPRRIPPLRSSVALRDRPMVLGRDGRRSGHMLAAAAAAGLCAAGRDVVDAGVAATPTLGVLVSSLGAAGGLQVTASHNPQEYNGLKGFGAEGRLLDGVEAGQAAEAFREGNWYRAEDGRWGRVSNLSDPHAPHLERLLGVVDVDRIRRQRYRVLLDANHGAGGCLGRKLLEELGCEVHVLGETPDGAFEHPPEPLAENLKDVAPRVPELGAAVGFCQDPDADRLALIDAGGRYLGEEYTLAICADHVLEQNAGAIVTNGATSRMLDDVAQRHRVPCFRVPVGEVHVVEAMDAHDAVLGGEGNGGVIDPRVGYVRDSFVAMALVLDAMASRGESVAELARRLPAYHMIKGRFQVPTEKNDHVFDKLLSRFDVDEIDEISHDDGLRLDWPDRWLLARPSNTEPLMRLIVEATTAQAAQELYDEAANVIASALGKR
jgi:phosphomannomutase